MGAAETYLQVCADRDRVFLLGEVALEMGAPFIRVCSTADVEGWNACCVAGCA